jgi:hypothetical protein
MADGESSVLDDRACPSIRFGIVTTVISGPMPVV